MRLECDRDHREMRDYPRGERLTITPMDANNIRYQQLAPWEPHRAPVNPPPIRATAKEIAEDESGIAERYFRRTRNAMFSSRD